MKRKTKAVLQRFSSGSHWFSGYKKINVKREYYRAIRAMLSSLYKTGTFTIEESEGKISQLEGRLSFIDQIDHYNNIHNGATKSLNAREKQYRDFLFL